MLPNVYLYRIQKYGVSTNNVLSMTYAFNTRRDMLVKTLYSCQLSRTFINIEVKQYKNNHLTLREIFQ